MTESPNDLLTITMWVVGGIGALIAALLVYIVSAIVDIKKEMGEVMAKVEYLEEHKIDGPCAEDIVKEKMVALLADYKRGQEECKRGQKDIVDAIKEISDQISNLKISTKVLEALASNGTSQS